MKFFTKTELRIFLIFWIIFSVFITDDRWVDNSSLDLTMAIVDERRFEIDSYANNTGDRAYYKGHYYSDRVPGAAFLAVPLYMSYKFFLGEIPNNNSLDEYNPSWKYQLFLFLVNSLISAVFGALTIILVYRISKYFTSNKTHRNLVIIVLGLGTLLLHAGRQFTSHAPSTFFIFLCFYLVFKMKKEKKDYSLIAGISGGLAVLMEYRAIIILVGIFVMVLISKKLFWILKFTIGVLMFYSILLLYDYTVYGSPFDDSYGKMDKVIYQPIIDNRICNPTSFCFGSQTTTLQRVINTISYDGLNPMILKWGVNKAIRSLFDPFRGLFFYSPIILLSFVGLFFMYKKYKSELLIILVCFFIYLLQITSQLIWWHGPCFGPRHLTPFIPFLMIPLFYVFKKLNNRIVLFFIIISILINLIGLQPVSLSHAFPIPEPIEGNLYSERMYSFLPLANPLFEDYIPSLLNYNYPNPEPVLVLERLLGFRIVPFANILVLLTSFLLIWKNKSFLKE